MKRILSLLCFALLVPVFSARAGKVVTDTLYSEILGAQVKYNVYLPNSFGNTEKLYPVVYLLHGLSDTYTAWVQKGNMQIVVDELMGTGEACEMVIIMPNAGGPDISTCRGGIMRISSSRNSYPRWRRNTASSGTRATAP